MHAAKTRRTENKQIEKKTLSKKQVYLNNSKKVLLYIHRTNKTLKTTKPPKPSQEGGPL